MVKTQHAALQVKYDRLAQEKRALGTVFKQRMEEWKGFKAWLQSETMKKEAKSAASTSTSHSPKTASAARRKKHDVSSAVDEKARSRKSAALGHATNMKDGKGRSALDVMTELIDNAQADVGHLTHSLDGTPDKDVAPAVPRAPSPGSPTPTRKRKRHATDDEATDPDATPQEESRHSTPTHQQRKLATVSTPPKSTQKLIERDTILNPPSIKRIIPPPPLFNDDDNDASIGGDTKTPRRTPQILVPTTSPEERGSGSAKKTSPFNTSRGVGADARGSPQTGSGKRAAMGMDFTARMVSLTSTPKPRTSAKIERTATPTFDALNKSLRSSVSTSNQKNKATSTFNRDHNVIDLTIDSQGSETQPLTEDDSAPPSRSRPNRHNPTGAEGTSTSSPYKSPITLPTPRISNDDDGVETSSPDRDLTVNDQPSRADPSSSLVFLGVTETPKPVPLSRANDASTTPMGHAIISGSASTSARRGLPAPPLSVARLRQGLDTSTPGASSSKTASRNNAGLHVNSSTPTAAAISLSRHQGISLSTPKTRSELPTDLKKPRGPEVGSMTEPRAHRPVPSSNRGLPGRPSALATRPGGNEEETETDDSDNDDTARFKVGPRVEEKEKRKGTDRRVENIRQVTKYTSSPPILQSSSSPAGSPVKKHTTKPTLMNESHVAIPMKSLKGKEKEVPTGMPTATTTRPEPLIMTREEREQHLRELNKKPASEIKRVYAPFKGRGRYAQPAEGEGAGAGDINAEYEIDKEKNGGMDQPYEEVVRKKSARKKMHAADCECCKDVGFLSLLHGIFLCTERPDELLYQIPSSTTKPLDLFHLA